MQYKKIMRDTICNSFNEEKVHENGSSEIHVRSPSVHLDRRPWRDWRRCIYDCSIARHVLHHKSCTADLDESEPAVAIAFADVEPQTACRNFIFVCRGWVICVRRANGVVGDAIHFDVLLTMVVSIDEGCGVVFVHQWFELFHLQRIF